jgi:hypothetical protein
MKKEHGGLGVPELRDLDLCLLGSWVKRYIMDEGKLWRKVIDRKYYRRGNIFLLRQKICISFLEGCDLGCSGCKTWV